MSADVILDIDDRDKYERTLADVFLLVPLGIRIRVPFVGLCIP